MIPFPAQDKQFIQTNRSNVLGNLWSTYNMDFMSNWGVMRVAPRIKLNTNGLDGCPVTSDYFDAKIWSIAGTKIYGNGGTPSGQSFSEDASAGVATDYTSDESDAIVFNGALVTTTTDELISKASNGSGTGAWTSRDVLNTGGYHGICYFKKFDRAYYANQQDNILSIDTAWATADPGASYAISLSGDSRAYTITKLASSSTRIWIGIIDKSNEMSNGKVIEWDGLSAQISNEYKLPCQGCLTVIVDIETDTPYAMGSDGVLYKFNGQGFSEVGRLPITDKLLDQANAATTNRFIHPRGIMFTRERTVRVLVNNKNADGSYNENFAAGVYEFDLKGGCVHVGSPSYTSASTVTDYGQQRLSRVGVLQNANVYSSSASRNGTFILGCTYFTNASATSNGIFYDDSNDTLQKYGYFAPTWYESSQVKETWQKIHAFYRQFLDSGDKIVVKYRLTDSSPTLVNITWDGTSTFTTTTDLSSYVGYEVEVVQGTGSGKTAHISSVTTFGSTYIVTLDDTFTGVTTGTAIIRLQAWIKMGEITGQTKETEQLPVAKSSRRIQLKCCMQFTGKNELYTLALINQPDQLSV